MNTPINLPEYIHEHLNWLAKEYCKAIVETSKHFYGVEPIDLTDEQISEVIAAVTSAWSISLNWEIINM